ncbi:MAG: diphosphate--fructose-6-phosphate 1-phosphotransferase [Candidatus Glassbacteria bacterium]|nr:diphosphate--fructose-6-phosphate 1-phosphotransferase [Candidatus Glassbacteria bacterium]
MQKGNAVVGQSGGPTSVINASLAGVIEGAIRTGAISGVYGMRWGIEGFMQGMLVDLKAEHPRQIQLLKNTPSSALGSSRHKLRDEDFPLILQVLRKYDIRYFFMIGGNDSMDTINRVAAYCRKEGYELNGIGVPKTVDNDLFGTDHTPGYPSAARYVALSVQQGGRLARDMQKVDQYSVYQAVGRDAGWLAASAVAAKRDEADPPHILLIPERVFDKEKFLDKVGEVKEKYGFCSISVGEGVSYADGTPISASQTEDKFGNVEFGAMGGTSAAMMVHKMISERFEGWRGEFQVVESLQMCASDRVSGLDIAEAHACGLRAVELAAEGKDGLMVSIVRGSDEHGHYRTELGTARLEDVAERAKPMPAEYIDSSGMWVTEEFINYLRPLVGKLPEFAELEFKPVK